ncbi:MAG: MBL fold metallo-hydrolase [Nitrospirota bacterium]|jgi:flavorubredoxin
MDKPTMFEPYRATPDIDVLPAYFPVPGFGVLPVNSFVLRAAEPVLVDSGMGVLGDAFMEKLSSVIDPGDLKWLWLTHTDQDHVGSLWQVLKRAPKLRVITTYLGMGKMSLYKPLPMDRVLLLNPGQSISVGDRKLTAIKPPTFDAPETTGFYDPKAAALFSADCFGALMKNPVERAADISSGELKEGLSTWATVDSPWLHVADRALLDRALDGVRKMSPKLIVSSHLPPATDMTEELLGLLAAVPGAEPFVGPDQQALEAMIREGGGQ